MQAALLLGFLFAANLIYGAVARGQEESTARSLAFRDVSACEGSTPLPTFSPRTEAIEHTTLRKPLH